MNDERLRDRVWFFLPLDVLVEYWSHPIPFRFSFEIAVKNYEAKKRQKGCGAEGDRGSHPKEARKKRRKVPTNRRGLRYRPRTPNTAVSLLLFAELSEEYSSTNPMGA